MNFLLELHFQPVGTVVYVQECVNEWIVSVKVFAHRPRASPATIDWSINMEHEGTILSNGPKVPFTGPDCSEYLVPIGFWPRSEARWRNGISRLVTQILDLFPSNKLVETKTLAQEPSIGDEGLLNLY